MIFDAYIHIMCSWFLLSLFMFVKLRFHELCIIHIVPIWPFCIWERIAQLSL